MNRSLSVRGLSAASALVFLSACSGPGAGSGASDMPDPIIVERQPAPAGSDAEVAVPSDASAVEAADQPAAAGAPVSAASFPAETRIVEGGRISRARAFPTGDPATSAVMVEKVAPAEVRVGESYEYEIRVQNLTGHPLEQVVVDDRMTGTFEFAESEPAPISIDGGLARFAIGDLAPGASKRVLVRGTATAPGAVRSCSEVSYIDRLCLETRVVDPRLEVIKTGPEQVLLCDVIPYRVEVRNGGSGTARQVVVKDALPEGLVALDGGREIVFRAGDLAAGESASVDIQVKAERTGIYENSAEAASSGGLHARSGTVRTQVVQPVLSLAMNCPDLRFGGQSLSYRVAVTNLGDAVCDDTVLEASIPDGCTFESATGGGAHANGKVAWRLGRIDPGQSADVEFTVRADTLGPKRSVAQAVCACADPATTECTVEVRGVPAVLLEVIDVEDPVVVGDVTTYVIEVTNQGTRSDTNIAIVCELESEAEFVSGSGDTPLAASGRTVAFEPLAVLEPKQKARWQVRVRAVAPGDVRFSVRMDTDELTRPVEETEATHFYR